MAANDKFALVGSGTFVDTTGDAKMAEHPARFHLPIIAPAFPKDEKVQFVTTKVPLTAVGCWRVPGHFFNFDSTFVLPDAQDAFHDFGTFYSKLADSLKGRPPMTLFGHADPVGPDHYNLYLSQRRAMAIYGVFTRDVDAWEELYNAHAQGIGKPWGNFSTQRMLGSVKDGSGAPYYAGDPDGKAGSTVKAVQAFQKDHKGDGLSASGILDKKTRAVLFPLYMDFLAGAFKLGKDDFLGKGQGKGGVGDFQGCGEFNPVMLFSEEDEKQFKKPQFAKERDKKNRRNRRVIAYLFLPGSEIDLNDWPCPNKGDGPVAAVNKCKSRFWSDGEARRTGKDPDAGTRSWFEDHERTFACRFYQGFAARSPCEEYAEKLWKLKLVDRQPDGSIKALANRRCVVHAGDRDDAAVVRLYTDEDGLLRIPMFDEKATLRVKVEYFGPDPAKPPPNQKEFDDPDPDADEGKFLTFLLDAGALEHKPDSDADQLAIRQRLHDLGYGPGDLSKWAAADDTAAVNAFRAQHGLPKGGPDADFIKALRDEFGDDVADPHEHDEDDLDIEDKE